MTYRVGRHDHQRRGIYVRCGIGGIPDAQRAEDAVMFYRHIINVLPHLHKYQYYAVVAGKRKKMKFNTLHKHNDKKCKNHLAEDGSFDSLCMRKQVQNTGGSVEVKNRQWFMQDVSGNYSIKISDYEIRDNYCAYCIAIAHSKERKDSHAA